MTIYLGRNAALRYGAYKIVAIYALFAALWILFSDRAVEAMVSDPERIIRISMLKGWFFVGVTSLLLLGLVKRLLAKTEAVHRRELTAVEAGKRTQSLLDALAESTGDAVFAKDTEGRYILFNRAAANFVGKTAAEILGHDDRAIFPPQQASMIMGFDRQVMADGNARTNEERLDTALGPRTFLATKGPLHDSAGMIIGTYGISHDISQRKAAEDLLRDREQILSAIVNNSPSMLSLKTPEGRYVVANPNLQRALHLSEQEIAGKTDFDLYPHAVASRNRCNDESVLQAKAQQTLEESSTIDGQERLFLSHLFPIFGIDDDVRFICRISLDITESRQTLQALQHSERRFRDIAAASADWFWEVDAQARYTYASESVQSLLGYSPGEILGKTPFDLMPPEEAHRVSAAFAASVARREPFRNLDNINVRKDGTHCHVQTNGLPILDENGVLTGYRGLDRDMSNSKRTEAALAQLANDLAATLSAIPDLLFEVDDEGRYIKVEATSHHLLAAPVDHLIGRTVNEILPPPAARTVMDALAVAARSGTDYGRVITLPLAAGDRQFELSVASKKVMPDSRPHFIVLSRDISARTAVQNELLNQNAELERFNRVMIGRELDMIELKKQINALSMELGRPAPFSVTLTTNS